MPVRILFRLILFMKLSYLHNVLFIVACHKCSSVYNEEALSVGKLGHSLNVDSVIVKA